MLQDHIGLPQEKDRNPSPCTVAILLLKTWCLYKGSQTPSPTPSISIFFHGPPAKQNANPKIPDRPPIFFVSALDGQNGCVGHARWLDWRGRAVRIGNDLTKIYFLLKNAVLEHFWPFLDLLDVRNGSGSKFRVYGWYRDLCTTKISPFRGKSVIRPPFALFFSALFLACVKKHAKLSSTNPPHPPTLLTNTKSFNKKRSLTKLGRGIQCYCNSIPVG